jgi:TolB-like protein
VIRRLPLFLALATSSCGYEIGNLYEIRDVKVDTFDNQSERRTQEFDLTDAVVREISSRGIRVNAKDAAYTLKGRIMDMRTPSRVDEKGTDQVLVGSVVLTLEIRLIDANGTELWKDLRAESASFTLARGESFESARQKIFDKLSRWVVSHLEKQW